MIQDCISSAALTQSLGIIDFPAESLVRPAGFEPATCGLEVRCSNPLSYGRITEILTYLPKGTAKSALLRAGPSFDERSPRPLGLGQVDGNGTWVFVERAGGVVGDAQVDQHTADNQRRTTCQGTIASSSTTDRFTTVITASRPLLLNCRFAILPTYTPTRDPLAFE